MKKYLQKQNKKFRCINLNKQEFDVKAFVQDVDKEMGIKIKYDRVYVIFNNPNGFNPTDSCNLDKIKFLKNRLKCPFYLLIELISLTDYNSYKNIFQSIYTNRQHNFQKTIHISFAADEKLLYPDKDTNFIRILVDHPTYEKDHFEVDKTKYILHNIINSRNILNKSGKKVIVRRFVDGKIETVKNNQFAVEPYKRVGVNILDAYKEYNKSDIFVVTHPESMGLSVIECAMAGCLIVTPKNYIKQCFLDGLNYYEFEKQIDWSTVLRKLNSKTSRGLALKKTWTQMYKSMFKK
jgi:hypothetical protein